MVWGNPAVVRARWGCCRLRCGVSSLLLLAPLNPPLVAVLVSWLTFGLVPVLLFTSRPCKGCREVKRLVSEIINCRY